MKSLFCLLAVLSLMGGRSASCFAQAATAPAQVGNPDKNENGFRGIPWGAQLDAVPGMKRTGGQLSPEFVWYQKEGDQLQVGNAKLFKINYLAYKGRLFRVTLEALGDNEERLTDVITAKYGKGERVLTPDKFGSLWPRDLKGPQKGSRQFAFQEGETFVALINGYSNGFGSLTAVSLVSTAMAAELEQLRSQNAKPRPGDF